LPVCGSKVRHFPDPIFLTSAWSERARKGQKDRVKKMGESRQKRSGAPGHFGVALAGVSG
jgi:hypothetical protein